MGNLRPEFVVERQGRSFALFQGVLDLAHQEGLKRVETTMEQAGDEDNERTWIFRAVVETGKGVFTAHGDASPANVGRGMLTVLPRLAETRAIARALRWATNVGAAALEELADSGDEGDEAPEGRAFGGRPEEEAKPIPPTPPPPAPRPSQAPAAATGEDRRPSSGLASERQVGAIYAIAQKLHGMGREDIEGMAMRRYGARPSQLSPREASELISELQGTDGKPEGRPAAPAVAGKK